MHESFDVAIIARRHLRHMAIGAIHRRLRVIKCARALPGNATGLPVVVLVEAANPAVVIHGHVQMNLVARRTKLGRICTHKRLQKGAAVRLRVQPNHEIVQLANEGIFAGSKFMEFRIFEEKVALAHGALHFHNAVAHQAAEAGARFRAVNNLFDGRIKQTAVKQSRIVAAGAPFGRTHTGDFLHVLDALAIPLIVEGREMVHRAVPLFVDIRMAALASVRFHEVLRGNVAAMFGLRGAGEEFPLRAVAFRIHGFRRHQWIGDAIRVLPGDFARPPCSRRDARCEKS